MRRGKWNRFGNHRQAQDRRGDCRDFDLADNSVCTCNSNGPGRAVMVVDTKAAIDSSSEVFKYVVIAR